MVVAEDCVEPLDEIDRDGWVWRLRYFGSSLRLYVGTRSAAWLRMDLISCLHKKIPSPIILPRV